MDFIQSVMGSQRRILSNTGWTCFLFLKECHIISLIVTMTLVFECDCLHFRSDEIEAERDYFTNKYLAIR